MNLSRRRLLSYAGLGAAALAPTLLHANPAFDGFRAARTEKPWLAGWEDLVDDALPRRTLALEGKLPEGLAGTLYRNGPARFERAGFRYHHWFDGDGLVHAWRIGQGRVTHEARFVETAKFRREEQADRFVVPAAGTAIPGDAPMGGPDGFNAANTAVIEHAGRLYALWEGGSAYELDRATLASKGPRTWRDDLASMPFSAHPLHDTDGSLWNFGSLPYLPEPKLVIWRIGADGAIAHVDLLDAPNRGYLHAFSASARHLVFVFAPLLLDLDAGKPFFESQRWTPSAGSVVLVVDKADRTKVRRYTLPAGLAFHYGAAVEREGRIELPACWYDDGGATNDTFAAIMRGAPDASPPLDARLVSIGLELRSERASLEDTGLRAVEFPTFDARTPAPRHAFLACRVAPNRADHFDAIARWDSLRGRLATFRYGAHHLVEEHRYVPRPGSTAELDGWLVGTALDWKAQRTVLSVFDARRIEDGPLAQATLPRSVPLGFHGWFAPA